MRVRFRWEKLIGGREKPSDPSQEQDSPQARQRGREQRIELREPRVNEDRPELFTEVPPEGISLRVGTPEPAASPPSVPQAHRLSPDHRPQVLIREEWWKRAFDTFRDEAPRKRLELAQMEGGLSTLIDLAGRYEQMRTSAITLHDRLTSQRDRAQQPLDQELDAIRSEIRAAEEALRVAERDFRTEAAGCGLNVKEISLDGLQAAINAKSGYDPNRQFTPMRMPEPIRPTPPSTPKSAVERKLVDWTDIAFAPISGTVFGVAFMTAFAGMNADQIPAGGQFIGGAVIGTAFLFGCGILLALFMEKLVRFFNKKSDSHGEGGQVLGFISLLMLLLWIGEIYVEKRGLQMLHYDFAADLAASAIKLPPQPEIAYWFCAMIFGSFYFGLKLLKIERAIVSEIRFDYEQKEYEEKVRQGEEQYNDLLRGEQQRVAEEERAFETAQDKGRERALTERDSHKFYDTLARQAETFSLNSDDFAAKVRRRDELERERKTLDGPIQSPDLTVLEQGMDGLLGQIDQGYERIQSLLGVVVVAPQIKWQRGDL